MKNIRPLSLAGAALLGLFLSHPPLFAEDKPARPNIVVVIGDDLGPDGLGCYGSELYKNDTPAIDKLAAGGLKFNRCYATAICSPSRAQYATGQYPFRNGTLDIDGISDNNNPNRPSITKLLKEAGYTTAKTGKADICKVPTDESLHGAQYWAAADQAADKQRHAENEEGGPGKWKLTGPAALKAEDFPYFPDAQVAFNRDYIQRHKPTAANGNKPFYLLVGLNNPHVPIMRTSRSRPEATAVDELYRDNIRFIDHVVGSIVEALQATGQLDNTLILVTGDNGSLINANGVQLQSKIWDPKKSTFRPIEGGKADRVGNREGSAWVPLIAFWPSGIPKNKQGTATDEMVDFSDFLPTFAQLAGANIPSNWTIDGHSFAPLLRGQADYKPREWSYYQIENNWCVRVPGYRLNRDGRFFDMSDAPFHSKLLTTLTPEQQVIRDRCQAILDQLDPASGNTYEAHQDMEWKNPALAWKKKHFGQDASLTSVAGDRSDPDSDGVTNIFERAFGWDPKKGTDKMPAVENGSLTVPAVSANDVEIIALGSSDGSTWTPLQPAGSGPFTFSGQSQGYQIKLEAKRTTPWKEP